MIESVAQSLESGLPNLMEAIKTESVERENADSETLEQHLSQIRNLKEVIAMQKKLREESEDNTL